LIDAIRIRMGELAIDRAKLGRILSTTSDRVSEIPNRRRRLTIDMIRRLAEALGLSERSLLHPYELAPRGWSLQAIPPSRDRNSTADER
jgi:HTH-type transcriptional regulator/antitoxin HigA